MQDGNHSRRIVRPSMLFLYGTATCVHGSVVHLHRIIVMQLQLEKERGSTYFSCAQQNDRVVLELKTTTMHRIEGGDRSSLDLSQIIIEWFLARWKPIRIRGIF